MAGNTGQKHPVLHEVEMVFMFTGERRSAQVRADNMSDAVLELWRNQSDDLRKADSVTIKRWWPSD